MQQYLEPKQLNQTMAMETVVMTPQRFGSSTATREQTRRLASVESAVDVGQRLTSGESALLLGAFATLAASMASFITL